MKNEELRKTYNKIAKDWNSDHSVDDWWVKGADSFMSLLPKGSSILDIGCGGGYKTKYMFDNGYKIKGIDFSEEMISCAKEKYTNINFEVFDVYDLDNINEKFDGIFCQAVLLHIPKDKVMYVLEKMKSILNLNGLLYIAVKEVKEDGIEEKIVKENDYGYEYERFFSFFTTNELRNYFKKLGMVVIHEDIVNSGRSNWINIIGKK